MSPLDIMILGFDQREWAEDYTWGYYFPGWLYLAMQEWLAVDWPTRCFRQPV